MMIDHNHTHQWEQVGVRSGPNDVKVDVIYLCSDCDAWTSLSLKDTARVPFRQGELADE